MQLQDLTFTAGGGELGRLVETFDWSATSLGPISEWRGDMKCVLSLVLNAPIPITTLWGRDGIMIYNDAYAKFAAVRHPKLLGANVLEAWPEAAMLNARVLAACLSGQSLSYRDEHVRLNRHGYVEDIWLDLYYSPISGQDGKPAGVLAIVNETTQRVRLEAQRASDLVSLNAAAMRQRCLVELGDRLRRLDTMPEIARAAAELLSRTLNCARAGYATICAGHTEIISDWVDGSVPSLTGRHLLDALGPNYLIPLMRGDVLAIGDASNDEKTAANPDAWRNMQVRGLLNVPLVEDGRAAAMVYLHDTAPRQWTDAEISLARDIADRTWEAMGRARAITALRQLNETLEREVRIRTEERDRFWNLSADIMLVAGFDTRIHAVNPAWTSLLGWREDELVGRLFTEFMHPDDVSVYPGVLEIRRHKAAAIKLENRYRARDGRYLWISWTASVDEHAVHAVGRDITTEKEQAEALQAAEAALRHAQKMEAVGQLTGGIAHDFNNLLQGIVGSLDLVQRRIETGRLADIGTHGGNAMAAANRAIALTHRLLAFSRRQPLDPKQVDANRLITDMDDLLRRTLGAQIELSLVLAGELWSTLCDPHQLDSAILNLAINARDAMPEGGRLVISTSNISLDAAYRAKHPDVKPGDYVQLCVTDTGTGMSPDVIERAFDPFYTTKPIGQGTGLGLSMIYGFMQQSGGHAQIRSAPGAGTSVLLYLPRSLAMTADDDTLPGNVISPYHETAGPGDTAGGIVLVLEDEAIVRTIVVEVLEDLGLQAIEAASGPAGLEILQSRQRIDLLVTDIGLPGLNGRQVAEAARLLRPDLKILFMTGYAETAAMADGFLLPGMEMITKPFAIESLAERIRKMVEGT
jgi:PAS domain S-box-containing protein